MTTPSLRQDPERAAFAITTLVALVPVWTATVFPSQDGGAHLYNAHVLTVLAAGGPAARPYADVYAVNVSALANWADHVALGLLSSVTSPGRAEQLLVSAYVLLFAAAARYATASIRPGHGWVAHLALPLVYTFSVQMGFYNFILTFPLYFFLIGFYWRHRDGRPIAALAATLLALYVLHPLAWLFGVLSLTVIVLAGARDVHAHGHTSPRTTLERLGHIWAAATPGAVLLFVLVGQDTATPAEWQPLSALLRHLYFGGPLWTFGPLDTALGGAIVALYAGVSVLAWRSARHGDAAHALAWVAGAYGLLVLILPSQWQSLGLITERVATFAFLTWVLALAGYRYSPRMRTAIVTSGQILALLVIVRWTVAIERLEPYVNEYLSVAPHVQSGRRVLELNFATRGRGAGGDRLSHPVAPFAHTMGLIGARRNAVVLNDYEALTAVFPLRHRAAAAELLKPTLHDPPDVRLDDLDRYEQATCQPIDYIVVWQADVSDARTGALLRNLEDEYAPTYVSRPGGYVRLYERRGAPPCR